ncbi:hypothetical protein [Paenibacillus gansuensis]|uniref:Uncharacterized protein n=1 Tax=Paenibacillus gansuensis TaxID=306542 RepID=A0ABW5PF12_9BACL
MSTTVKWILALVLAVVQAAAWIAAIGLEFQTYMYIVLGAVATIFTVFSIEKFIDNRKYIDDLKDDPRR